VKFQSILFNLVLIDTGNTKMYVSPLIPDLES